MTRRMLGSVAALLVAALTLAGCGGVISGHGGLGAARKVLSHAAVETYIYYQLGLDGPVICNNGRDFPMHLAGEHFQCIAAGAVFKVTIENPITGVYIVS